MMDMMPVYFFTTTEFKNFLFKGLNISGVKAFVALFVVMFLFMALFEGAKLIKIFFELKVKQDPLTYGRTDSSVNDNVELLSSLTIPSNMSQIRKTSVEKVQFECESPERPGSRNFHRIKFHFLSSVFHMVNLLVAYVIMLAYMTYSAWVAIAITLGSGAGYWVFGYVQQQMVDKFKKLNQIQTQAEKDRERQSEVEGSGGIQNEPCHM